MECGLTTVVYHHLLSYVRLELRVGYLLTHAPAIARIAWYLYRQGRIMNHFLQSNGSLSRANYYRIIILASADILFTLPIGIVSIALAVKQSLALGPLPFYFGWTWDHTDWEPEAYSYAELVSGGTNSIAQQYFSQWTSPILAFIIFGLFGVTSEARTTYWQAIRTF